MTPHYSARLRLGACALLAALAAGCGGRPVVSGTVTYKGAALTTGEVSFIGPDGPSRSAQIGADGRYEIPDAPSGEVTIVVIATRLDGGTRSGSPLAGSPGGKLGTVRSLIPLRYGDPATSDLRYKVVSGRQTKDIELTD